MEVELLSVVFGLEKLHHYVFDRKINDQTDTSHLLPNIDEVNCSR